MKDALMAMVHKFRFTIPKDFHPGIAELLMDEHPIDGTTEPFIYRTYFRKYLQGLIEADLKSKGHLPEDFKSKK